MMSEAVQVKGVRGPSGEFGALGVVELQQDARYVFEFMRRIEEQPKWHEGVKMCEIISKVANTTHVKQVLQWSFLALRGDFNMNLAMHEEPSKLQIRTEMLKGSMMRRFSSNVGVQPVGNGKCKLEMSLYMQPMIFVPFGIRHMVGSQVRRQLHSVLEKIKETVEKQPPRRSLQLSLPQLPYSCDINGLKDAIRSHPLDISVWG
jgi:hypothetical protein